MRLLVDTLTDVVLAPNAAVQLGQNGPFVYVVKDGKTVEVRKVKTGATDAGAHRDRKRACRPARAW